MQITRSARIQKEKNETRIWQERKSPLMWSHFAVCLVIIQLSAFCFTLLHMNHSHGACDLSEPKKKPEKLWIRLEVAEKFKSNQNRFYGSQTRKKSARSGLSKSVSDLPAFFSAPRSSRRSIVSLKIQLTFPPSRDEDEWFSTNLEW